MVFINGKPIYLAIRVLPRGIDHNKDHCSKLKNRGLNSGRRK